MPLSDLQSWNTEALPGRAKAGICEGWLDFTSLSSVLRCLEYMCNFRSTPSKVWFWFFDVMHFSNSRSTQLQQNLQQLRNLPHLLTFFDLAQHFHAFSSSLFGSWYKSSFSVREVASCAFLCVGATDSSIGQSQQKPFFSVCLHRSCLSVPWFLSDWRKVDDRKLEPLSLWKNWSVMLRLCCIIARYCKEARRATVGLHSGTLCGAPLSGGLQTGAKIAAFYYTVLLNMSFQLQSLQTLAGFCWARGDLFASFNETHWWIAQIDPFSLYPFGHLHQVYVACHPSLRSHSGSTWRWEQLTFV